jgi:hypothetical protein
VAAFAITGTAFISLHYARIFPAEFIYDNLLQIMTFLNITAIFIALILFAKGVYLPSTADHGSTEHFLFRIYWGEELYPSVLGVDLKHFIICRVGMIAWWLFTMSFVFASIRHHGGLTPCVAASAGVNFLYVLKFSVFEVPGYLSAADIAVDRWQHSRIQSLRLKLHTCQGLVSCCAGALSPSCRWSTTCRLCILSTTAAYHFCLNLGLRQLPGLFSASS